VDHLITLPDAVVDGADAAGNAPERLPKSPNATASSTPSTNGGITYRPRRPAPPARTPEGTSQGTAERAAGFREFLPT
jgi:hypothetical protein